MKYLGLKVSLSLIIATGFYFKAKAQTLSADSVVTQLKADSLLIDSLKKVRAEAVYFEVGGAGVVFSLNYDTRFGKRRDGLGLRIGAGFFQYSTPEESFPPYFYHPSHEIRYITVPFQLNYLIGKQKHFVEIGAGATYTLYDGGGSTSIGLFPTPKIGKQSKLINTLTLGYRNQPLTGGLTVMANAGIFYTAIYVVPTVGLSLGYTFKDKHFKTKAAKLAINRLANPQPIKQVTDIPTQIEDQPKSISTLKSNADSTAAKVKRAKSIYAELIGAGLLFSGNYDFRFAQKRGGWGARIGIGYVSHDERKMVSFPVQINYLIGDGSDFFEIGLGASYLKVAYQDINTMPNFRPKYMGFGPGSVLIGTATFGYRYQPPAGNFNFRATLNPLFNDKIFTPSGGVSIGYLF